MSKDQFRKRIKTIFEGYGISGYGESASGSVDGVEPPWVEFYLRRRDLPNQTTYVSLQALKKLSRLLGTEDIRVTGWDAVIPECCCDNLDPDCLVYIVAYGVKFGRVDDK